MLCLILWGQYILSPAIPTSKCSVRSWVDNTSYLLPLPFFCHTNQQMFYLILWGQYIIPPAISTSKCSVWSCEDNTSYLLPYLPANALSDPVRTTYHTSCHTYQQMFYLILWGQYIIPPAISTSKCSVWSCEDNTSYLLPYLPANALSDPVRTTYHTSCHTYQQMFYLSPAIPTSKCSVRSWVDNTSYLLPLPFFCHTNQQMFYLILWGQYIIPPAISTSKCSVWSCEDNTSYLLPYLPANALSDPVRTTYHTSCHTYQQMFYLILWGQYIIPPAISTSKCSVWSCEDNTSYLLPYLPANALSDPVRTTYHTSCHTYQQMFYLSPAIPTSKCSVRSWVDNTSYLLPLPFFCHTNQQMFYLILWGQYIIPPAISTSKCSVWSCEDNTSYLLPYLPANALSDPVRTTYHTSCHTYQQMFYLILWGQYIIPPAISTSKCSVWSCEDNTSYLLPYLPANALSDPVRTIHHTSCHTYQ